MQDDGLNANAWEYLREPMGMEIATSRISWSSARASALTKMLLCLCLDSTKASTDFAETRKIIWRMFGKSVFVAPKLLHLFLCPVPGLGDQVPTDSLG